MESPLSLKPNELETGEFVDTVVSADFYCDFIFVFSGLQRGEKKDNFNPKYA
nr:hypothetical protein [Bacillus sp. MUM 13]